MDNIPNMAMRDVFFDRLFEIAMRDNRVIVITDDFGAPSLDKFRDKLSDQYINVGVAEQNSIGLAAGLAKEGRKVFVYGIAPFITSRCFEQIKLDLCAMKLPVTLVGVGGGFGYGTAGPTHHNIEDIGILRILPEIVILSPCDNISTRAFADIAYSQLEHSPKYIRLDRGKLPDVYTTNQQFQNGLSLWFWETGKSLTIIASGIMVHRALEIAQKMHEERGIIMKVVDLYRIKPANEELLLRILDSSQQVVTIEEHFLTGGIGSLISEVMADNGIHRPMLRFGIPDRFFFIYGGREQLYKKAGLDTERITKKIHEWTKRSR